MGNNFLASKDSSTAEVVCTGIIIFSAVGLFISTLLLCWRRRLSEEAHGSPEIEQISSQTTDGEAKRWNSRRSSAETMVEVPEEAHMPARAHDMV